MIDQWAEQTCWQLLELMTSAEGLGPVRQPATLGVLRQLANNDHAFETWLRSNMPQSGKDQFVDWTQVAEKWIVWLADLPLDQSVEPPVGQPVEPQTVIPSLATSGQARARGLIRTAQRSLISLKAKQTSKIVGGQSFGGQTLGVEIPSGTGEGMERGGNQAAVEETYQGEEETCRAEVARDLAYDMAYGLSHELNNPLANIAARARLLAEEETCSQKRRVLASIVDQAMRGCEMIADLMLVARPPVLAAQPLNLNCLLREMETSARAWASGWSVDEPLELQWDYGRTEIQVVADPSAVREAVWALLRNAIEAARHSISVSLSLENALSVDKAVVHLRICDDGPGLSAAALHRAFHPYFSGREAGRGLGLGLSKAERVAHASHGFVTIANRSEGGCEVCLSLPCTTAEGVFQK